MARDDQEDNTELVRLGEILAADGMPRTAMNVAMLEGWLAALAIGPRMVRASDWLPWVWDFAQGRAEPVFASSEQAGTVLALILGWSNRIADVFERDPASFAPVSRSHAECAPQDWCAGFLQETQRLDVQDWTAMYVADALAEGREGRPSVGTPFMRLGDPDGRRLTEREGDAQRWVDAIGPALVSICAYWAARRGTRPGRLISQPTRRTVPKGGPE